ncbi:SsgA family sporulation/cell division regulator [Nonomuraea jabiensis]|uniref:SsgA family sporulation/cell division regulator n=1 Tax=Nonomuraea jabiensis TaxID=882448 RepID=UPI00369B0A1A
MVEGKPSVSLPAELRYDSPDPYAVCPSLGAPLTSPIDWLFARGMLAAGLHMAVGTGDVKVAPHRRGHPDRVRIVLRSGTDEAAVDVDTSTVRAFPLRTLELVPTGTESMHTDLDRALGEFLEDSE